MWRVVGSTPTPLKRTGVRPAKQRRKVKQMGVAVRAVCPCGYISCHCFEGHGFEGYGDNLGARYPHHYGCGTTWHIQTMTQCSRAQAVTAFRFHSNRLGTGI